MSGSVDPEFEGVREEFTRNFAERGELGAACAVYHRGRKVVDLWGGSRNAAGQWEHDTLVLVFSATKGLSAMAMAVAHSQGLLRYEETVASYWPEFAQNGKQDITVRQLLCHQGDPMGAMPQNNGSLSGRSSQLCIRSDARFLGIGPRIES